MRHSFLPSTDSGLLAWANNFAPRVWQDRESLAIPLPLANELLEKQQAFAAALSITRSEETRTRVAIAGKNRTASEFRDVARRVVSLLKAVRDLDDGRLDDAGLVSLGLTVPKRTRGVIRPPEEAPFLKTLGVSGRAVALLVNDAGSSRSARPTGTIGISLSGAIGEHPPVEDMHWTVHAMSTRTRCTFLFPAGQPAGTKVWIVARWVTRRGAFGPTSRPVAAHLGYSMPLPGAAA